eukprot:scaffold16219_cov65-Phaeocystis_antarctica.AAC.1
MKSRYDRIKPGSSRERRHPPRPRGHPRCSGPAPRQLPPPTAAAGYGQGPLRRSGRPRIGAPCPRTSRSWLGLGPGRESPRRGHPPGLLAGRGSWSWFQRGDSAAPLLAPRSSPPRPAPLLGRRLTRP